MLGAILKVIKYTLVLEQNYIKVTFTNYHVNTTCTIKYRIHGNMYNKLLKAIYPAADTSFNEILLNIQIRSYICMS